MTKVGCCIRASPTIEALLFEAVLTNQGFASPTANPSKLPTPGAT